MANMLITVTKPGVGRANVYMPVVPRIGESMSVLTDDVNFGGRVIDVQYTKDERSAFNKEPVDIEVILG